MSDISDSLRSIAEKIAADADTTANTEPIRERLTELVDEYNVPLVEAEHTLRNQYDAVTHTTPPEPAADLLDQIEDGHVTAVRTTGSGGLIDPRYVVAGTIELSEEPPHGWVATLHDATAWKWQAGEPGTVKPYLEIVDDEGAPKAVRNGDKDSYSVNPGLHINDGEVEVLVRSPAWSKGAVEHYLPQPIGTVGTVLSGQIIEPKKLLPGTTEVEK